MLCVSASCCNPKAGQLPENAYVFAPLPLVQRKTPAVSGTSYAVRVAPSYLPFGLQLQL